MAYTVVLPALNRMDHCKPALEYVREVVREQKPEIHLVLVPLVGRVQENLVTFVDTILVGKGVLQTPNETCEIWHKPMENYGKRWHDAWRDWIESIEYIKRGSHLSQIFVVLSSDLPNGIVLASATSALSVPNLKLIEMPVGYDLTVRGDDFNPGEALSTQVIDYPTWGSMDVQDGMVKIASKIKVGKTLAAIRNIADRQGGDSLASERVVSVSEIKDEWQKINKNEGKPKTIKSANLSNHFKELRSIGLINKIENKRQYVLTPKGVSISGLFRNTFGMHNIMDENV